MRRFLPQSLLPQSLLPKSMTGQLMVLLAVALVVVNLLALAVLGFDRARALRDLREGVQLRKVADLVASLSVAEPRARRALVRRAREPGLRLQLARRPMPRTKPLNERRMSRMQRDLSKRFLQLSGVGAEDVLVRLSGRQFEMAVRLAGGGPRPWLNIRLQRGLSQGRLAGAAVAASLLISLLTVLLVAFLFMRRIVRPLDALRAAMDRAGAGDREVRAPVAGPRETASAARTFNAMQDSIAAFEAERARTAAAIGHDLRTPITSLRIRAEMLDDDATRDAMVSTLDDMRVMADGLLTWGRSGGEREAMGEVDLQALLSDLVAARPADARIVLQANVPLTVRGRPVALRRAFDNLIDNALRHAGSAEVTLAQQGGSAIVTVADRGPGLPVDQLETVLEPFARGEAARSPVQDGGTGLGLSIARDILRAHGGSLSLGNRDGGGLIVRATLPTL